jgi:hypothetical protein
MEADTLEPVDVVYDDVFVGHVDRPGYPALSS